MQEDEFVIQKEENISPEEFILLVQRVWPGQYDLASTAIALSKTVNFTARRKSDGLLVGEVRLLTDGYFFSTVSEVLVDPQFQNRSIGKRLMELLWENSKTTVFLGAQPGKEGFYEKLGYEKGLQSYTKKKPRQTS